MDTTDISLPIEIPNFRILGLLGQGGMGKVYLAEQQHPQRNVVIKVVDPDAVRVTNPKIRAKIFDRLQREGDIAARFQHPNLVTVFECGVVDDHYYIAMEYLSGGDLRSRIQAGIGEDEAVEITAKIASGLAEMHRLGLLHRDLKPENILLRENGEPVLVDFGIAKERDESTTLTELGVRSGTPHYMSPEHVSNAPMDGRSDLYALGIVFYELLTSEVPFEGNTNLAIGRAHLEDPIPSLPARLESYQPIIDKLLAKRPSQRYQSAEELIAALRRVAPTQPGLQFAHGSLSTRATSDFQRGMRRRWLAVGATVAIVLLGLAAWQLGVDREAIEGPRSAATSTGSDGEAIPISPNSIAVLPFVNMSADTENEYFSDGISEEILNTLARLDSLRVAARTSSFQFKGQNADVATIGKALRVQHVLEGSVRKVGDRVRVTAQLVDATSGYHLWSETWDRELTDIFAIQDEIAESVTRALQPELMRNVSQKAAGGPHDLEAYDLYLLGRHHLHERNRDALERARVHFRQATMLDPDFALAHVGLANATILLLDSTTTYGEMPLQQVNTEAQSALNRALELQPNASEVHASRGLLRIVNGDYEAAVEHLSRAIELNPNFAIAYMWRGTTQGFLARFDRCLADLEQAQQVDPLSPAVLSNLVWANHLAGDPGVTEAYIREALRRYPEFVLAWGNAGNVRYMQGRHEEARRYFETAYERSPSYRLANEMLGRLALDAGDVKRASKYFSGASLAWPLLAADDVSGALNRAHEAPGDFELISFIAAEAGQFELIVRLFEALEVDADRLPGSLLMGSDVSNLGRLPALTVALALERTGDLEAAQRVSSAAERIIENGWSAGARTPGMHYAKGVLLALQGNVEGSLASLEAAIDAGWRSWWYMAHDARLGRVRDEPRFRRLLLRITPGSLEDDDRVI